MVNSPRDSSKRHLRWQFFTAVFQGALSGAGGVALFMAALYFLFTTRVAVFVGLLFLGGYTALMLLFSCLGVKAAVDDAREKRYLAAIGGIAFCSGLSICTYVSYKLWPELLSYFFGEK